MKHAHLIAQIKALQAILASLLARRKLHDVAIANLGKDLSNIAPNALGCAESVSFLIKQVLPAFPLVTGTYTLMDVLTRYPGVKEITPLWPEPGDIVLYATGQGLGVFPGHVGIVGENRTIMSNDSKTGKFSRNYTVDSFHRRYAMQGGFPEHIFRIIK